MRMRELVRSDKNKLQSQCRQTPLELHEYLGLNFNSYISISICISLICMSKQFFDLCRAGEAQTKHRDHHVR
ncbi:Protein of unknown function [Pyronema omphalodes CBS 100304]|uniref:Uncharacterized protein n=1 Tax=Pyronema omphalodes (strain CBS 100304) TaxID=1076935 RepID=U4LEQ7_PYROM|nr:Protein of unknown function [Pyronema omphalodes CBS 100304]